MRGRRLWIVLGAIAVAAALAVGGVLWASSGDEPTKAAYTAAVVAARDRVDAALVRITKSPTPQELIERIDEAADQADIAADGVEDVGAAPGFEQQTDHLVSTLRKFAGELEGTARTLEDPQFGNAADNVTSLSFQQWNALNKVLTGLQDDGIAVEPLPRH